MHLQVHPIISGQRIAPLREVFLVWDGPDVVAVHDDEDLALLDCAMGARAAHHEREDPLRDAVDLWLMLYALADAEWERLGEAERLCSMEKTEDPCEAVMDLLPVLTMMNPQARRSIVSVLSLLRDS